MPRGAHRFAGERPREWDPGFAGWLNLTICSSFSRSSASNFTTLACDSANLVLNCASRLLSILFLSSISIISFSTSAKIFARPASVRYSGGMSPSWPIDRRRLRNCCWRSAIEVKLLESGPLALSCVERFGDGLRDDPPGMMVPNADHLFEQKIDLSHSGQMQCGAS